MTKRIVVPAAGLLAVVAVLSGCGSDAATGSSPSSDSAVAETERTGSSDAELAELPAFLKDLPTRSEGNVATFTPETTRSMSMATGLIGATLGEPSVVTTRRHAIEGLAPSATVEVHIPLSDVEPLAGEPGRPDTWVTVAWTGDPSEADRVVEDLAADLPAFAAGATATLLVRPVRTGTAITTEAAVVDGVLSDGRAAVPLTTGEDPREEISDPEAFARAVQEAEAGGATFALPDGSPRLTPEESRLRDEPLGGESPTS